MGKKYLDTVCHMVFFSIIIGSLLFLVMLLPAPGWLLHWFDTHTAPQMPEWANSIVDWIYERIKY